MNEQQIDIFSFDNGTAVSTTPQIEVEQLEYVSSQFIGWEDLFSGFDEIRAITFSSGMNFAYKLL